MRNQAVVQYLENIARLLAIKGESAFRVRAYDQAAQTIAGLTADIADFWGAGRLDELPGVGPSIAAKIDEVLRTGRCQYYEELRQEIAPGAAELLDVPSIGPARARQISQNLAVTSLAELAESARTHRLRALPGFGAKSEERILREVQRLQARTRRLLLGVAWPAAAEIVNLLRDHPAVRRAEAAGSLRRQRETVGDLDIVAASERPETIVRVFTSLPIVGEVLSAGETRASILTDGGAQVDLRVVRPDEYGAALMYFTGSKGHNIAMRDRALARGLHLSEYGLFDVDTGRRIAGETEAQVFEMLGLDWIPPELRENRGEIAAAERGELPDLIDLRDLRGDLHLHTDWSDGGEAIETMAVAARARGYEYIAITDHSRSLGVAHGLSVERLAEQARVIADLNRRLRPFRILRGIELEVRGDGSLDYPDEVLAGLDFVGASAHSGLTQPSERYTQRVLNALHSGFVDVLNHPTGRLIDRREGAALDLGRVIRLAAVQRVALEINGQPDRLDLDDTSARRASQSGVLLACGSDAHSVSGLDNARYAIAVARRAWLRRADVLNAQPLRVILARRHERRPSLAAS
jgi:DNA polymerase (family X)